MKILQIIHSLPFLNQAGTEIYAYNLSCELSKRHTVYIFSRTCDTTQKDYEITVTNKDGMEIYFINNTFKYANSFQMYYNDETINQKFAALLDNIKPDLVHIHHLIFLSVGLIKIINDRGIPIVFHLHDYWLICPQWHILVKNLRPCEKIFNGDFDRECLDCVGEMLNITKGAKGAYLIGKRFLPDPMVRWIKSAYFLYARLLPNSGLGIDKLKERRLKIRDYLSRVSFFIAPSEFLRNKFIQFGVPSRKIKFFQNGFSENLFINTRKADSDKIRFAFIGTLLPAKGLHILLEAFNRIDAKKAELKIYGRIYSYAGFEYYLPFLKKNIKNKNIKFAGEFDHAGIVEVFKEIDVLVVPSIWYENSPLVIQEAILSRTPVIASRIGGIPELIEDGVNGLLFTPGDANDLRRKIESLVKNRDIIEKLKKNTTEIMNIEANASEVEAVYRGLLTSAQPDLISPTRSGLPPAGRM
jgi:glycosyltransferase involved in cell wall biosynthesis